jgi:hypothetical protein
MSGEGDVHAGEAPKGKNKSEVMCVLGKLDMLDTRHRNGNCHHCGVKELSFLSLFKKNKARLWGALRPVLH